MYSIAFDDGTTFEGGNPSESRWGEIPKKPIKSIDYSLTPFITYHFEGFEAYNHMIERIKGVNKAIDVIDKVCIMGLTKNRVYQILLIRDGSVFQLVVPYGKEYSPQIKLMNGKFNGWENGKSLAGWREGLLGGIPKLTKEFKKQ
jgi:hypothetical protein